MRVTCTTSSSQYPSGKYPTQFLPFEDPYHVLARRRLDPLFMSHSTGQASADRALATSSQIQKSLGPPQAFFADAQEVFQKAFPTLEFRIAGLAYAYIDYALQQLHARHGFSSVVETPSSIQKIGHDPEQLEGYKKKAIETVQKALSHDFPPIFLYSHNIDETIEACFNLTLKRFYERECKEMKIYYSLPTQKSLYSLTKPPRPACEIRTVDDLPLPQRLLEGRTSPPEH